MEKIIMMVKIEDCRRREKPTVRWTDSIKEATGMSLQELSRAVGDRTLWPSLIHRVIGSLVNSVARNTGGTLR